MESSPTVEGISLTSDPNVLSLQVETNDTGQFEFQVDIQSRTAITSNNNLPINNQFLPNVTIPNLGDHIEVWGMKGIEENSTIITVIVDNEVKGNYTIPNRIFYFGQEENLTKIDEFTPIEGRNIIYFSETLNTLFIPTWPTINAASDLIYETYYSFELDGSNLYHPIITAHGVLSYADIASKSFPSPYSRFYDFEGLIYVFYGASGSCYSGYIIHYTKTSIEILHNLPYGHQRELFDIRTKEYIRWYNSYDFQNLVFEGVKIIKSSYINDSKTEYLIPYDTFPIFPNEVDSFTELPVSWISMFVSIPFLLSINRKRRQHK